MTDAEAERVRELHRELTLAYGHLRELVRCAERMRGLDVDGIWVDAVEIAVDMAAGDLDAIGDFFAGGRPADIPRRWR